MEMLGVQKDLLSFVCCCSCCFVVVCFLFINFILFYFFVNCFCCVLFLFVYLFVVQFLCVFFSFLFFLFSLFVCFCVVVVCVFFVCIFFFLGGAFRFSMFDFMKCFIWINVRFHNLGQLLERQSCFMTETCWTILCLRGSGFLLGGKLSYSDLFWGLHAL